MRELVKKYLPKSRSGGYLDVAMIPQPGRKGATVMVASTDPVPVMPAPYPSFRIGGATVSVTAKLQPTEATQQPDDIVVASIGEPAPLPEARPADLGFDEAVQAANTLASRPTIASIAPQQERPLDVIGAWLSDTFSLGSAPAPLGQTAPSAPLLPPVGIGEEGQPIDLMTSGGIGDTAPDIVEDQPAPAPLAVEVAAVPQEVSGSWIVQIARRRPRAAPTP